MVTLWTFGINSSRRIRRDDGYGHVRTVLGVTREKSSYSRTNSPNFGSHGEFGFSNTRYAVLVNTAKLRYVNGRCYANSIIITGRLRAIRRSRNTRRSTDGFLFRNDCFPFITTVEYAVYSTACEKRAFRSRFVSVLPSHPCTVYVRRSPRFAYAAVRTRIKHSRSTALP